MFKRIYRWFLNRFSMFVIADASDNSITFSKKLFNHMRVFEKDAAKVYVFFIPEAQCYGFMLNPELKKETQLADIQYNSKYKSIGFESLIPTVNKIFYDYGLPAECSCMLSVKPKKAGDLQYYQILPPYGKHSWEFPTT